jgi:hypothetical protein
MLVEDKAVVDRGLILIEEGGVKARGASAETA